MAASLTVENFLKLAKTRPVIDVRAPKEFAQGHLPNAVSMPLFDDEQRAVVGTAYKHNGRQAALLKGLEIVGPKMRSLAEQAISVCKQFDPKCRTTLLHCWRGGMRSQSVAWLMEQAGLEVHLLDGGYKSYRQHVLSQFRRPWPLIVLSGLTGAGKTVQLKKLAGLGEQVIDLEALANHQGSAFGGFDQPEQPTVEQFENDLADRLRTMNCDLPIWIEDESQSIGRVAVPTDFFRQYRLAPAIFLDVPRQTRAEILAADYGAVNNTDLVTGIESIRDRLGGQNVNQAKALLAAGNPQACASCLLEYYDKAYLKSQKKHPRTDLKTIKVNDPLSDSVTRQLLEWAHHGAPATEPLPTR